MIVIGAAFSDPDRISPVQSSLVQSSPVRSGPIRSSPVQSSPVQSSPVQSGPVRSGPIRSGPVRSDSIRSGPVRSDPIRSDPIRSGLIQFDPVQSSPVQSNPVQSSPIQSNPVQSSPVRSSPVQSGPVQSSHAVGLSLERRHRIFCAMPNQPSKYKFRGALFTRRLRTHEMESSLALNPWYKEPLLLWRIIIEGKKIKTSRYRYQKWYYRSGERSPLSSNWRLDCLWYSRFAHGWRFPAAAAISLLSKQLTIEALRCITLELDRRKTGWRKGTQCSIGAS